MSLESGYSTDQSVPAPADSSNIIGPENSTREVRARTVHRVQPAEEPTESAAKRALVWEAPVEGARGVRSQGTQESLYFSGDRPRLQGQSGEREHSVFYLIFENICQRAWFCKDVGRCKSNDLGRDAPSRAHASFANAREA